MLGVVYPREAYLSFAVLPMLARILARSALNGLTIQAVRSTTHSLTAPGARSASQTLTFRATDER